MKRINVRVKEIEVPRQKREVYLVLSSMLNDLSDYSTEIYEGLVEKNYRVPESIEMEDDYYMSYLEKIVRENKCDNAESLLETLRVIKQVVVDKGLNESFFDYDVERTSTGSLMVSISVYA